MCIVFHKTVAPTFRGFDSLAISNLCVTDFALRQMTICRNTILPTLALISQLSTLQVLFGFWERLQDENSGLTCTVELFDRSYVVLSIGALNFHVL